MQRALIPFTDSVPFFVDNRLAHGLPIPNRRANFGHSTTGAENQKIEQYAAG
jgi:hypothetical protein